MRRNQCERRLGEKGFTLIEMLLVVVIIGILAGMVATNLSGRSQQARITRVKADISGQMSLAVDLFEQDVGRFPSSDEGLAALVEDTGDEGWRGPYLKGDLKPDPWGTAFSYSLDSETGRSYAITSAGPDREFGTEDDISL